MIAGPVPRTRFCWRDTDAGLALHLGRGARSLALVVADGRYPGMYRVQMPDGSLSDMVNLTRAKDAGLALARRVPETAPEAAPMRLNGARAA